MTESKTILVVEDNPDFRRVFSKALELEHYDVLEAADGTEAFDLLKNSACPDLILLDLSMPNMNGAEFLKRLRDTPKCSKAKVVVLSGWDNLAVRARDLGADGYIPKPVDLGGLYEEVRRHLQ
jgi:CheY-like chemotaxis protein